MTAPWDIPDAPTHCSICDTPFEQSIPVEQQCSHWEAPTCRYCCADTKLACAECVEAAGEFERPVYGPVLAHCLHAGCASRPVYGSDAWGWGCHRHAAPLSLSVKRSAA